jgi:putative oxidoreductase
MEKLVAQIRPYTDLIGRILLGFLLLKQGWDKIGGEGYVVTQFYMELFGAPAGLLPLVILLEVVGGLAIILGVLTRPVALVLAVYMFVTALMFHMGAEDSVNFWKNIGLAGGFILLVGIGGGRFSIDQLLRSKFGWAKALA